MNGIKAAGIIWSSGIEGELGNERCVLMIHVTGCAL